MGPMLSPDNKSLKLLLEHHQPTRGWKVGEGKSSLPTFKKLNDFRGSGFEWEPSELDDVVSLGIL